MADDAGELKLETFRAEAREWLEANFPKGLRGRGGAEMMEGGAPAGDAETWRKRIAEKGWGAPTWPKQYGGGGL